MAKKQRVSVVGTVLTIEYPSIGKKFVVDYSKYSEDMNTIALAHGWKQKYGDAASGKSAEEKYEEVQKIHEAILAGEWERTASPDQSGEVIEAVCNLKGYLKTQVEDILEKEPKKLIEWKAHPAIRSEIARMRAVKAAERAKDAPPLEINL